jgi:hypothetical protein
VLRAIAHATRSSLAPSFPPPLRLRLRSRALASVVSAGRDELVDVYAIFIGQASGSSTTGSDIHLLKSSITITNDDIAIDCDRIQKLRDWLQFHLFQIVIS